MASLDDFLFKKKVILIEPYIDTKKGHSLEKLILWVNFFLEKGSNVIIYTYNKSTMAGINRDKVEIKNISSIFVLLGKIIFKRYRNLWKDFWTYFFAFKESKEDQPIFLGLTLSNPISLALASVFYNPYKNWGQIVMSSGLKLKDNQIKFNKLSGLSLKYLDKKGCSILCNLDFSVEKMKRDLKIKKVFFLNDPIFFRDKTITNKQEWENSVIVSGGEDWRRTPIEHIKMAKLNPMIDRLFLHQIDKLKQEQFLSVKKFVYEDKYFFSEELFDFFADKKFSFIIYAPKFIAGSANLATSILAGTPVLSSNFIYAKEVFEKYGKVGEMFEYKNIKSFQKSWENLTSWKEKDWEEFYIARMKFIKDVNMKSIFEKCVKIID